MSTVAVCPECGASDHFDPFLCGLLETDPPTAAAPPPPPPAPPAVAPRVPALAGATSAGSIATSRRSRPVPPPAPYQPLPPTAKTRPARKGVVWRWGHLWLIGICAWGVPESLSLLLSPDRPVGRLIDASLLLQIFGYLLAVAMAYVLVYKRHDGNWETIGIYRSGAHAEEILRGMGFGVFLFALFLPIGYVLGGGRIATDLLVRTLVGNTSGAGLILAAIVLVIGAPVIEEIYFRGMLYEKLARRSVGVAVVVSSLLFVAAHGAIIIPALLLFAFGVGLKRRTKSIYYTMAAHGAWNFIVLMMAAFVVFSPASAFSPADGAYSLKHPPDWERLTQLEGGYPGATIDLALGSPNGSFIGVERVDLPLGSTSSQLPGVMKQILDANPMRPVLDGPGQANTIAFNGLPPNYELTATMVGPDGTQIRSRVIAVLARGSQTAVIFDFACPRPACEESEKQFDRLLRTVNFSS